MRLNPRAASSLASALASSRVALLLAGVLVLSESVVLASTLFAGACISLVAGLLIATKIYRTTRSEHEAWCATRSLTLPSARRPVSPRLPTTSRSASRAASSSAGTGFSSLKARS
jgi:hypothetical protein